LNPCVQQKPARLRVLLRPLDPWDSDPISRLGDPVTNDLRRQR
jgi:hypothetical protein